MIGCLVALGSKPVAFEDEPLLIDSLIDGLDTLSTRSFC